MKKWLITYTENEFGKIIGKYKVRANSDTEALAKADKRFRRWKLHFHKTDAYYTNIIEIKKEG